MGTATINRFFGLHVWLMPAVLVMLVGAHLAIFRHNGSAGPVVDDPRKLRPGRFWPDQMFMDGAFSFIVFVIIVFLALVAPPYLDAKADPTKFFVPYPAWYFLSLFGLLALVPPEIHLGPLTISLELIATIIVPTLFLVVVLLIPWLDRSTTRSFGARAGLLWSAALVVCVIVGLTIFGQATTMIKQAAAPASPPESVVLGSASAATLAVVNTAGGGASAAGAAAPAASGNGAKVFAANCSSCHGATGQGVPGTFPPLANNPVVTGDPGKVIGIVLGGLHGPITVNGQTYNGVDAAVEGHAFEQRDRRRHHLHSRIAREQQSLGRNRSAGHRLQAVNAAAARPVVEEQRGFSVDRNAATIASVRRIVGGTDRRSDHPGARRPADDGSRIDAVALRIAVGRRREHLHDRMRVKEQRVPARDALNRNDVARPAIALDHRG